MHGIGTVSVNDQRTNPVKEKTAINIMYLVFLFNLKTSCILVNHA